MSILFNDASGGQAQTSVFLLRHVNSGDLARCDRVFGLSEADMQLLPAGTVCGRQEMHIRFAEPENAVAPGQIAAVYLPGHASEQKDGASGEPGGLRLAAGGIIRQHS